MASSKSSRALFISEDNWDHENILKIQMPTKQMTRWNIGGLLECMSITPDDELLVVSRKDHYDLDRDDYDPNNDELTLSLLRLEDASEKKCILLPSGIGEVSCAAQLPNKNFIISYSTEDLPDSSRLAELPNEGYAFTRHFDLSLFDSIQQKHWNPYCFAIKDDGQIIVGDRHGKRLICFNSKFSDYLIISSNESELSDPHQIIYINENQQLLGVGNKCSP